MGLIDEQIAGFSESELGEFRDSMPVRAKAANAMFKAAMPKACSTR
jgi:hypothetical protein